MDPLPWYRVAAPFAAVAALAVLCAVSRNPRFRAMLLGVGVLGGYAVAQDQVSVRLCPEYFTAFHNPIPGLTDPTLLGAAWGFLGASAGGAALGYAAGFAATTGPRPRLTVRELVRPMLAVVLGVAVVTAITGVSADRHAEMFAIRLDPDRAAGVPPERQQALFVVACYHLAAYAAAVVGSVTLCVWIGRERARRAQPVTPAVGGVTLQ